MLAWQTIAPVVGGLLFLFSAVLFWQFGRLHGGYVAAVTREYLLLSVATIPCVVGLAITLNSTGATATAGARVFVAGAMWLSLTTNGFARRLADIPPLRYRPLAWLVGAVATVVTLVTPLAVRGPSAPGARGLRIGLGTFAIGPLVYAVAALAAATVAAAAWRCLNPRAPAAARASGWAIVVWAVTTLFGFVLSVGFQRGFWFPGLGFLAFVAATWHAIWVGTMERERERIALDRELAERTREARDAHARLVHAERLSSLGRLAGGVAHEVSNPAAFVLANLAQLREQLGPREPSIARMLDDSLDGIRRIRVIVTALRALSRGDEDALESVRLDELADVALLLAAPSVKHGIEVVRELGPTPEFVARPGQLMQVLLDLIGHAADAVPAGRGARVTVRTRGSGETAILEVRDDVPADAAASLGDLHAMRLDAVRSALAIIGGALSVTPRGADGMARIVRLPATVRARRPSLPAAGSRSSPEPATPARPLVLLVDDEPALLRVLSRVIGRTCEVVTAPDAAAARDVVAKRGAEIDLVLCDVLLADANGVELRDELVALTPTLADRFTFMTGGGLPKELGERLAATGCAVLEKPIEVDEITAHLVARIGARAAPPAA